MRRHLDAIDRKILNALQRDGRLSIVELANRVGLTKTPCAQRVRRLERSGKDAARELRAKDTDL